MSAPRIQAVSGAVRTAPSRAALMLAACSVLGAPLAGPVGAQPPGGQSVMPCDGAYAASVAALAEPWEENSRSYADGAIRVSIMDQGDPACCAMRITVLHPDVDGYYRQCKLISQPSGEGFALVRFGQAASYDPVLGLRVPMIVADYGAADFPERTLTLVINQATGEVTLSPAE